MKQSWSIYNGISQHDTGNRTGR